MKKLFSLNCRFRCLVLRISVHKIVLKGFFSFNILVKTNCPISIFQTSLSIVKKDNLAGLKFFC
jgi:hypothetical protein